MIDVSTSLLNVFPEKVILISNEEDSRSKDRELLVFKEGQGQEDLKVKNYREFISNLITVVRSGIWWDVPYQDLWINEIRLSLPKEKSLEGLVDLNSWLTEDSDSKFISLKITREKLLKLKTFSSRDTIDPTLEPFLNIMGNLVYMFFNEDWKTKVGELEKLVSSDISLKKIEEDGVTKHILRFTRKYQEKFYYLEVFFQGEGFTTQLRSNYVWYKDKEWRQGGYYASNGTNYRWRSHVGGIESKAKSWGYNWTEIDSSLSKLFIFLESDPESFLKWFKVLGKSLKKPEASKLFYNSGVSELLQLNNPISRTDSWNEQYYKKIHPLARLFYEEFEGKEPSLNLANSQEKKISQMNFS